MGYEYEVLIEDIKKAYEFTGRLEEAYVNVDKSKKASESLLREYEQQLEQFSELKIKYENEQAALTHKLSGLQESYNLKKELQERHKLNLDEIEKKLLLLNKLQKIISSRSNEKSDIDFDKLEMLAAHEIKLDEIKSFFKEQKKLEELEKQHQEFLKKESDTNSELDEITKALSGKELPTRGKIYGWWNLESDEPQEFKLKQNYRDYSDNLQKIKQDKLSLEKEIESKKQLLISIKNNLSKIEYPIKVAIENLGENYLLKKACQIDSEVELFEKNLKETQEKLEECESHLNEQNKKIQDIEKNKGNETINLEKISAKLLDAKQKLEFNKSQLSDLQKILAAINISALTLPQSSVPPYTKQRVSPLPDKIKDERYQELNEISKSKPVKSRTKEDNKLLIGYLKSRMEKKDGSKPKNETRKEKADKPLRKDHCSIKGKINKEVEATLNNIFGGKR